jgi:ABC-type multidrug transport system ATPase subunit
VWRLVERLKHGRAVLLTTHAMEEANQLADSVAILARGRLRCVGTPLALKVRLLVCGAGCAG